MKNLKLSIVALLLLLISLDSYAQSKDFNFIIMYEKYTDHYAFDPGNDSTLRKLYSNRDASSLFPFIQKGEKRLNMTCEGQTYLYFPYNEFPSSGIKFTLKLKNQEEEDSFSLDKEDIDAIFKKQNEVKAKLLEDGIISEFDQKVPVSEDLVLLNLSELLVKHFQDTTGNPELCCPENVADQRRNVAEQMVCQLMGIKKGIAIDLGDNDIIYNSGNDRSEVGKVPDIDPRNFLVVEEHDRKKNRTDTIWNEFERYKSIIDSRHEVLIRFKQEALKEEVFFDGNISLMAQINDNDPIEIPPYSVIGKDFTKVGVASLSPYDFALSFLSPMLKVYMTVDKDPYYQQIQDNLQVNNEGILDWLSQKDKGQNVKDVLYDHFGLSKYLPLTRAQKDTVRKRYKTIINSTDGLDMDLDNDVESLIVQARNGTIKKDTENNKTRRASLVKFLENIYESALAGDTTLRKNKIYNNAAHKIIGKQLIEYLIAVGRTDLAQAIQSSVSEEVITKRSAAGKTGKDLFQYSYQDIFNYIKLYDLPDFSENGQTIFNLLNTNFLRPSEYAVVQLRDVKSYFEKFMGTDRSTLFALLTEIHRDSLFLEQSYASIKATHDRLVEIKEGLQTINTDLLDDRQLTDANRIRIEDLVTKYSGEMVDFFRIMKTFRKFEQDEFDEFEKYYIQTYGRELDDSMNFLHHWAKYLALKAGRQIYKKLVIGKINLIKRTIEDDAKLHIYVLWHNEPGKDPQQLPIATFTLRRLGWNMAVAESALLIDRINDDLAAGSPNYSPSNFKPTAGASVLWTFTRGDIPRKRINKKGKLTRIRKNGIQKNKLGFFGWLEPSFGFNVSYLSFVQNKEFEIGAGPVIGFFRNKIFFTYGYNFSAEGLSPRYVGIGFSFANIFNGGSDAAKKNTNN